MKITTIAKFFQGTKNGKDISKKGMSMFARGQFKELARMNLAIPVKLYNL